MKEPYILLGISVALMAGCAEDATDYSDAAKPVSFITGIAHSTRTTTRDNVWNGTEQIAISDGSGTTAKTYKPDAAGLSVSLSPDGTTDTEKQANTIFWPIDKSARTFEAWYPYQATKPTTFAVAENQSTVTDEVFNSYDLLYASSGQLESGSTVTLNLYHQMAHVIVYIRGLAWTAQEITHITFGESNVAVTGNVTMGTTGNESPTAIWTVGDANKTATLRNLTNTLTYECLLPPQNVGSNDKSLLTFYTKTVQTEYTENKTESEGDWNEGMASKEYHLNTPLTLEAGKEYSFFIRLERVGMSVASVITDWDADVSKKEVEAIYQPINMGGSVADWDNNPSTVESPLDFTYTE